MSYFKAPNSISAGAPPQTLLHVGAYSVSPDLVAGYEWPTFKGTDGNRVERGLGGEWREGEGGGRKEGEGNFKAKILLTAPIYRMMLKYNTISMGKLNGNTNMSRFRPLLCDFVLNLISRDSRLDTQ